MKERLKGVFAATIAPMDEQGRLLPDVLATHVRRLLEAGITGIMANGHTGEILGLSQEERELVVRTVREAAGRGVLVLGGVHGQSTREAQEQARAAARAGADAVVIFSPFVFSRGAFGHPEAVLGFYEQVAGAAGVPILAMQYPPHSGMCMPDALLAEVVKLSAVVGIKQAVGDIALYEANLRTVRAADATVSVLTASEGALFSTYAVGCDGSLIGIANLPGPILELHEAFINADLPAARIAGERVTHLSQAIYALPSFRWTPRLKGALHELGWIPTPVVRGPNVQATPGESERIREALAAAGLAVRAGSL